MNSIIKLPEIRRSSVLLLAFVLITASFAPAQHGVAPPGSKPFGVSYGEWSASWWQWVFSLPATGHPLLSSGPVDCSYGQFGQDQHSLPVWFLVGALSSGDTTRSCTVPAGTWLFVPVLNSWCDNVASLPPGTLGQLKQCANYYGEASELHASIDGVPVRGLHGYRAASAPFGYTAPPTDNMVQYFGANMPGSDWPTTYVFPAASDGYWLMVAPLPRGQHVINFGGTVKNTGFEIDITYHITVP